MYDIMSVVIVAKFVTVDNIQHYLKDPDSYVYESL